MPLMFEAKECNEELRDIGIHADKRDYHFDYPELSKELISSANEKNDALFMELIRKFAKEDLFFLGYFVLNLPLNDPFLIARCYDVQDNCHFTVDLWSREHWKSSIITFMKSIHELIINPEERIGIFSFNRALAKGHMRRIKNELETNHVLRSAFPEIFYMNPGSQAPKWAENEGIYVKRKRVYNEASVEAWGLIEAMPTGKHFTKLVFDDVVTENSVNTPDQILKVEERFRIAQNLGARGGQKRVIGTRYSMRDVYGSLLSGKRWKPRIFPGEVDSQGIAKRHGTPVYLSREELEEKFDTQGEYTYSCQILQNPVAISSQKFHPKWISWYSKEPKPYLNYYMTVDPASAKKKGSDSTVMQVWGADPYKKLWLVDMIKDRLGLGEKWDKIKELSLKWELQDIGYEKYGMQADIEYFQEKMDDDHYYLNFIELGGTLNKQSRILKLTPYFQKGRIILPRALIYTNADGETKDLMVEFLEDEYKLFPSCKYDDMLDCMARILDSKMGVVYPTHKQEQELKILKDDPLNLRDESSDVVSWMGV